MSLRDPKTQRLLLAIVLCALAGWSYFLSDLLPFGYRKQMKKQRELRAAQETVAGELEKARRAVHDLPRLEAEQKDLEKKWDQAESLLPSDKEMAELLTSITQAGEQAGVTFQTFKPGTQKPQEFYNENPVEITVKGGFHQVGVFLARLANLPRIVNVSALTLDGAKQKSRKERGKNPSKDEDEERSDQTLTASFTATAYSLRDPAAPVQQAPAAEKGRPRGGQAAAGETQSSTGPSGNKTTPGGLTKRIGDKAKHASGEEQ